MESITGELAFMAASAGKAFVILMDPMRLMYLGAGWTCAGEGPGNHSGGRQGGRRGA